MSRNSRNRDIYSTQLHNAAQGDAEKIMKGLMASPYRKHRERALRVLQVAEILGKKVEVADEA